MLEAESKIEVRSDVHTPYLMSIQSLNPAANTTSSHLLSLLPYSAHQESKNLAFISCFWVKETDSTDVNKHTWLSVGPLNGI